MNDLISRQAAIDALYDKGSSMTAWGELLAMKWSDIQKCIEQLPSADRPRPIDPTIEVDLESGVIPISACEPKGPKTIIYADRPRGEWIDEDGTYYANCSMCGYQMDTHQERGYFRFCPNCGSDNRERSEDE